MVHVQSELLNIPFQLCFNEVWQREAQRGNVDEIFAWNLILKRGNCRRDVQRDVGCLISHTQTTANIDSQEWTESLSSHTHTFTSEIYGQLAQCDLQSYCCFKNCLSCHNLRCQNSRHTQPITAHFKGLFAQLHLAARLQITAYWAKQRTVSELTSPSRMPFMDKPIHCKKTEIPQRVLRQTHKHKQHTNSQHKHALCE